MAEDKTLDKEKIPGVLSIVDLSEDERELLLDYLESSNSNLNASFIFALLGDDDFLKFFDVMSGESIKVPSRDSILKIINYIKIYKFCTSKGLSKETYDKAAKIFGRRAMSIDRIVKKVQKVLDKE